MSTCRPHSDHSAVDAFIDQGVVGPGATTLDIDTPISQHPVAAQVRDGVVRPTATTQVAGTLLRYQHSPAAQFRAGVVRSCTAAGSQNTASRLYCSFTAHLSNNMVELTATAGFHRVFWVNNAVADYCKNTTRTA